MPDPSSIPAWQFLSIIASIIITGELAGWAYLKSITARDEYQGGEHE